MKRLLLILIFLFTLVLSGCDAFIVNTNITSPQETTAEITTENPNKTTSENTTEIPNTTTTTEEITTNINDDIYLKMIAGQDTVEINEEWIDAGAEFVLNDEVYPMTTTNQVDTSVIDVYTIKYEYEHNDIIYSMTRIVVVLDQTPPEIALNLGIDTVVVGSEWKDAGVTILDNSGEDINPTIDGDVDINTPGTYEIIYTAIDSSGNESTITRFVTVIESE